MTEAEVDPTGTAVSMPGPQAPASHSGAARSLDPTFRDPAGSLTLEHHFAVRSIHPVYRAQVLDFLHSSLRQQLEQSGSMVTSVMEDEADVLRLLHPRVAIPSYPWEWTRSQWLDTAQHTLALCETALAHGWILKDATPLNILFVGTRPILVDVLSFERYQPGSSLWLPYGQYVRTLLLPLVMHKLCGWPLSLSLFHRDGYEPAQLYPVLGWMKRLSPDAFWPITLPAWLERKSDSRPGRAPVTLQPDAALHALKQTLAGLRKRTRRAAVAERSSAWSRYAGTLTHYSESENQAKRSWVAAAVEQIRPRRVLDIGANTGEYSALVAATGIEVVALERDAEAADRLYRMSRERSLSIHTIRADIARPTPAAGWNNREYSPLLERLEQQFDLVMMLAVIHHLILMEQIPLGSIMALAERLTSRWLLLEWVPVADPMFQSLMRGRDALYGGLSEADLMRACTGRFCLQQRHVLGNGRVLMLLEKEPRC